MLNDLKDLRKSFGTHFLSISDELYGDFVDLETGTVHKSQEGKKKSKDDDDNGLDDDDKSDTDAESDDNGSSKEEGKWIQPRFFTLIVLFR